MSECHQPGILDADAHVLEPRDTWQKYIEPRYKDRAPVGTKNYLVDIHLEHDGEVISRDGKFVFEGWPGN